MYINKSPNRYYQGDGLINEISDYIPLWCKNPILVTSVHNLDRYHDSLKKFKFQDYTVDLMYEDCDCIIGVGGGSILDTAKRFAAHLGEKCYIIMVPTIMSNDSACTSMVVPKHYSNRDTMMIRLEKNPDVVLVDTAVITESDIRYFISGICDASSKYIEAAGCLSVKGTTMNHGDNIRLMVSLAREMSLNLNSNCLEYFVNGNKSDEVVNDIIYDCVYISGVISDNCGLSLPHAFALALDECTKSDRLHGEKVALGVLVASNLVSGFLDYKSFYEDVLGMKFSKELYGITEDNIYAVVNSVMSNKLIKNFYGVELTSEMLLASINKILS